LFLASIRAKLRDLEYHNFAADEVDSFKHVMMAEAKKLRQSDSKQFEKKKTSVSFLNVLVVLFFADPNEIWQAMFYARAKTIGIHNGQIPAMPWEALWLQACPLASVSETFKLDTELIEDIAMARRAALKVIGGGHVAFSEFRKALSTHMKAPATLTEQLSSMGPSWLKSSRARLCRLSNRRSCQPSPTKMRPSLLKR
jgi:hypothetical protein